MVTYQKCYFISNFINQGRLIGNRGKDILGFQCPISGTKFFVK